MTRTAKPLILVLLLLLAGCAAPRYQGDALLQGEADKLWHFNQLVDKNGCRNSSVASLPGSPHLRTTRFWQAVANPAMSDASYRFWIDQLRDLDRYARRTEYGCLEQSANAVNDAWPPLEQLEQIADHLAAYDREQKEERLPALSRHRVPDDYRLWLRSVGFYPLTRLPIIYGVHNAYQERREWFRQKLDRLVALEKMAATGPPPATSLASSNEVRDILALARNNPLNIPLPNKEQKRILVETFAPVFNQEKRLAADNWGAIFSRQGAVGISSDKVVYYYLDHLIINSTPLLRINYVIWHPGRKGDSVPWYERGLLDGITYGVVLDSAGVPLIASTMNNCGCYLQFYPNGEKIVATRDKLFSPDVLAPQSLPEASGSQRLRIDITSGWHQVVRIETEPEFAESTYQLRPYSDIERLLAPDGSGALFDPIGVLPGTKRFERFFFFGMGIPSVGSMRQRGHQPTTLLGREHYDDPDLVEGNFLLPTPEKNSK